MSCSIIMPAGKANACTLASFLSERRVERASQLDRRADLELASGRHQVAERLAHAAADLRMECAA